MTKLRAPLSVGQALDRIAGTLPGGWAEMATIADRSERHVRKWGDPDAPDQIPVDVAIAFDVAYQAVGGENAPIYETYGTRLEVARADRFGCQAELAKRVVQAVREGGDAFASLVDVLRDNATDKCRAVTANEVIEAIEALKATLPFLTDHTNGARAPP